MATDGRRKDFGDFTDVLNLADVEGLATALDGKAPLAHNHTQSEVSGLATALGNKAAAIHTHEISDVTDLEDELSGKAAANHAHAITDVAGLEAALDDIADTLSQLSFEDLSDFPGLAGNALKYLRVNAAANGVEVVPLSTLAGDLLDVGDPVFKMRKDEISEDWPYLPAWEDATIDQDSYPEFQPLLYASKAEINETDQFLATSISRTSNIVSLTLANTEECQSFVDELLADFLFSTWDEETGNSSSNPSDYTAWAMCLDIPDPIDFLPAGRYAIKNIDNASRVIQIEHTGSNVGATAVTEYVECYPFRKEGTNVESQWRAVKDIALMSGRVSFLRSRDQLQGHKHLITEVVWSGLGANFQNGGGAYITGTVGTGTPVTDGTNGNARYGMTTRPRSMAFYLYIYTGVYVEPAP